MVSVVKLSDIQVASMFHGHGSFRLAGEWRSLLSWNYPCGHAGGMLGGRHVQRHSGGPKHRRIPGGFCGRNHPIPVVAKIWWNQMAQLVSLSTIRHVGGYIDRPDFTRFATNRLLSVGWPQPSHLDQAAININELLEKDSQARWLCGNFWPEFDSQRDVFKTSGPLIGQHII